MRRLAAQSIISSILINLDGHEFASAAAVENNSLLKEALLIDADSLRCAPNIDAQHCEAAIICGRKYLRADDRNLPRLGEARHAAPMLPFIRRLGLRARVKHTTRN